MESPEIPSAQDKQLNNNIQSQNLKNKGNFKENKGNFKENKGNKGVLGIKGEIKENCGHPATGTGMLVKTALTSNETKVSSSGFIEICLIFCMKSVPSLTKDEVLSQ